MYIVFANLIMMRLC